MQLGDTKLSSLERQLNQYMTDKIIRRGWDYYRQGCVQHSKASTIDTLTGVVRGTDLYAVVMDADQFRYSSCTCPYDGMCKHMAAVLFHYISQGEGGHPEAEQSYFRLLGLAPASRLLERRSTSGDGAADSEPAAAPGPDAAAEPWLRWMEDKYGDTWKKCRHSLHPLQPVLTALKAAAKEWDKPMQRMHWTLSILFVLTQAERAIRTVDSFSRYYHEMAFARMAEPWLEQAYELIQQFSPPAMSERERDWADELIAVARGRAFRAERQLFDWDYLYLGLCERMSESRDWYEKELAGLLESAEHPAGADRNEAALHGAIGMMYFFDGQDELSIAHFAGGAFERSQKLIYPNVAIRMEEGRWSLAMMWMRFLYARLSEAPSARTVGPFLALCRRGDEDRPDLPEWQQYMTGLLPYSYSELSEHWIKLRKYEEWSDLQMLLGMKPEELDAAALREAAKSAPHVLLPLYHQTVEQAIGSRNRQGYRHAVKCLKKLEKLYKAMKETESWSRYLDQLIRKYQRLRALQEELWKGKLTT